MPEQITEAVKVAEAEHLGNGRYRVLCISEGKGSSGLYPRETLMEAANKRLIRGGTTFAYLDHPSATEAQDRPERSVRDLAGVFTSDATWDEALKGLVAEMQVFAPYRELIAEMKDHIGLSIRGDGEVEMREGQRTITSLAHIESVDFVTRAGRGGKVLSVLESVRPSFDAADMAATSGVPVGEALRPVEEGLDMPEPGDRVVIDPDRLHDPAHTTGTIVEVGTTAYGLVMDGMEAMGVHRWYTADEFDFADPETDAAAGGMSMEARDRRRNKKSRRKPMPGMRMESHTRQHTNPDTTKEALVAELTEAEVTALRDSAARAEAALAEAATLRAERDQLRLATQARPLIAAHLAEAQQPLPAAAQARVVDVVAAGPIPTNDQGIDTAALTAAVESAAAREAAYVRSIAPAAPTPPLYGSFGSFTESAAESDDDFEKTAGLAFGRKGN